MRILGACIFLSFLAGKLRDFKPMLLTCHETKKKKRIMAHAYFGRLNFFKFFGGKNNFLTVVIRGKTSRKKKTFNLLSTEL